MDGIILKAAAHRVVGRGYLSSDHIATATGKDPAFTISKNGGNFANPAAGASVMTEIEATGWYYFALAAGDTDTLGPLIIRGTHADMDNIEVVYQVVETVTAANVTQWEGHAVVAHAHAEGLPVVEVHFVQADVIDAAAIKDAAIDAATFAAGAINAAAIAADAIELAKIKDGAISAAKFAAGAIDANAIAANAIDAATFAADVDAEIAAMVWNAAVASYGGAGTYGQAVEDILADTNELQVDWVNGGRLDLILDIIAADTTTDIPATITTLQGNVTTIMADTDLLDDAIGGLADIHTDVAAVKAETALLYTAVVTNAAGVDIAADIIALKAETVAILADTNELQLEWVDGGRLDLILDIIAADTTTDIPATITTMQGNVTSILADTNELQLEWVDGGRLDLILDIIAADTTTDIPATITTMQGNVTTIMADTDLLDDAVGGLADIHTDVAAVKTAVDAVKVITDALTAAAAAKLATSAGTIVSAAAAAGTLSTTQMTTNLTEATDDHYNGRIIIWTSGVLINQATDITDYDGATKKLVFTAVTEAPTALDTFIIV